MSLSKKIEADYIAAYKAKDALRLSVLRMIKTAMTNLSVELKRDVADGEILDVILKQTKQASDSIEQFIAGGRKDLADKEEAELVILKEYLPQSLDRHELEAAIDEAIGAVSASSPKDMGKVMTKLMEKHKGSLDGKLTSELVKSKLQAL